MELAVLGVPVTPEEAHRIGLVHRVVPDALSEAMALAAHAARLPARAVAYTKRLVNEARTTPLPDGLKRERALFLDLAMRPEGIATMQAYEAGRHGFALRDGRWQVTMPLIILPGDFADPQVIALLHLHLNDAHDKSPPGTSYALDLSGLQVPEISFFAAWEGGRLAGIGALKTLSADWVEIKSMRTHPDFLRRGVAAAMLTHLLDEARRRGCKRVSLETGDHANFGPAIALYERFGFRFGEQFGDYVPSPFNQFMHLAL
jgi:putative acetyltransferase